MNPHGDNGVAGVDGLQWRFLQRNEVRDFPRFDGSKLRIELEFPRVIDRGRSENLFEGKGRYPELSLGMFRVLVLPWRWLSCSLEWSTCCITTSRQVSRYTGRPDWSPSLPERTGPNPASDGESRSMRAFGFTVLAGEKILASS